MFSRRLCGTRRWAWTTGGTDGSTVIWYWPWNFPIPSEQSGCCFTRSPLSFIGTFFSWARCVFSARYVCKEQFNVMRLSSKDVGSPMIAGPSASVIKKIASVLLPLISHVFAHLLCCFILVPPYALSTVGDCWTTSGLGKPSGLRCSGYIRWYSRKGSMLPWAPVSSLAFSVEARLLS